MQRYYSHGKLLLMVLGTVWWCWSPPIVPLVEAQVTATAQQQQPVAQADHERMIQKHQPWLPEEFPNPDLDQRACRTTQNRLCDPDGVFTESEIKVIEDYLRRDRRIVLQCLANNAAAGVEVDAPAAPQESQLDVVQIGLAAVERMDLRNFHYDPEIQGAEKFARKVHDSWGVGVQTTCGGTGVLVFVSTLDRVVYISRGQAMEPYLTNSRIDYIVSSIMRPYLQNLQYGQAVLKGLEQIDYYIQLGPATEDNDTSFWLTIGGILFGFSAVTFLKRKADRHRRQYAQVASRLSEIDEQRAMALQGQFQAKSCPICLEDFPSPQTTPATGSDGLPIKLLRCGHLFDETCWSDWVNSGHGQYDKCPVCREDVTTASLSARDHSPDSAAGTRLRSNSDQQGSAPPPRDPHPQQQEHRHSHSQNGNSGYRGTLGSDWNLSPSNQPPQQPRDTTTTINRSNPDRSMRLFLQERNFRLSRLLTRYPTIIRPEQINTWTSPTFTGPLAQDPAFVRLKPAEPHPSGMNNGNGSGSFGGGGSGFGGGISSGGRGGRW